MKKQLSLVEQSRAWRDGNTQRIGPPSSDQKREFIDKPLWLGVLAILKHMSSSMGRIIPYIMENKIHAPNYQPATYLLAICYIPVENDCLWLIYLLKMMMFDSYVSLPEGIWSHFWYIVFRLNSCQVTTSHNPQLWQNPSPKRWAAYHERPAGQCRRCSWDLTNFHRN